MSDIILTNLLKSVRAEDHLVGMKKLGPITKIAIGTSATKLAAVKEKTL
jgi:hypothetical protein